MAGAITIKVEGGAQMIRTLTDLSDRVSRKVQRKAVRAGATIMRKHVRGIAGAHKVTGNFRKSIKTSVATDKSSNRVTATTHSVDHKAHLIEFGTVERFHKSGKSTGAMPAFGIFRRAFSATVRQQIATMEAKFRVEYDKEAKAAVR